MKPWQIMTLLSITVALVCGFFDASGTTVLFVAALVALIGARVMRPKS